MGTKGQQEHFQVAALLDLLGKSSLTTDYFFKKVIWLLSSFISN